MINKNLSSWINLHFFYKEVLSLMKILNQQKRLNIITLKDYQSVDILCKSQHLNINRKQIIDASIISNKVEALNDFCKFNVMDKKNIIFVDDNIFHLTDPKLKNYSIFLASWCYLPKEYLLIAKENNIHVLHDIKDLINELY